MSASSDVLSCASDTDDRPATVGRSSRVRDDLTSIGHDSTDEYLYDIALSLRHICDHLDRAEEATSGIVEGLRSNKRLSKFFGGL